MEYQKIINLGQNKWRFTDTSMAQIAKINLMLKSSLCICSDEYILLKEIVTITRRGAEQAAKQTNERDKGVILKNRAPFTDCIRKINNTQEENVKDLDVMMLMYNLTES